MGTEVQSKMHLPGYYALRATNENAGNNSWPFNHNNKASENGQNDNSLKIRAPEDKSVGLDVKQLRQTILNHESVFRQQVKELHRLYRVQRELMNELKSKEAGNHFVRTEAVPKPLYSSCISSEEEEQRIQFPNGPSANSSYGKFSTSRTDSIRTPPHKNYSESTCRQNGVTLSGSHSLESKGKKLKRQFFYLDPPADEHVEDREKRLGISGASLVQSRPSNPNNEISQRSHVNWATGPMENLDCNAYASSSSFHLKRTCGLTDLNKPVQVEESSSSASASGDHSGSLFYNRDLSMGLYSGFRSADNESNRASLTNMHLQNGRAQREYLSYNSETGNRRSDRFSFCMPSYYEDSHTSFKSTQCETRIGHDRAFVPLDQRKTQQDHSRKFFGVELPNRDHSEFSVAACHTLVSHPSVPHGVMENSESSSILSSNPLQDSLNHNMLLVLEVPHSTTSAQPDKNSPAFVQIPKTSDESRGKLRSAPTSRAEINFHNSLSKGPPLQYQESRNSHLPASSVDRDSASEYLHTDFMKYSGSLACMPRTMSTRYASADMAALNWYQNDSGSQQYPSLIGGQGKQDRAGGLSLRQGLPQCNGVTLKEINGSDEICSGVVNNKQSSAVRGSTFPLLLKGSSSAADKSNADHSILGDFSTNRKVLEVPISYKPSRSQTPASGSSTESNCLSFGVYNCCAGQVGSSNCLPQKSSSTNAGEHSEKESLVNEKKSSNCCANLKHQIDLNVCAVEEDAPSAPPSLKISTNISAGKFAIDLEAPPVLGNELVSEDKDKYLESGTGEQSESLQNESESDEDLARNAAEAILAICLSCGHRDGNTSGQQLQALLDDPLHQLADIILSFGDDHRYETGSVSLGKDGSCHEDSIPEGVDYFEYMTLKLTEIKVEECHCKPDPPENPESEKSKDRRPRRGRARRGRQRKDFQRDILPGLTSLSKYEVTEDLQTFEGLIKATGGTWHSKRNTRGKSGRGRKRSEATGGTSSPSPIKNAPCRPQTEQPTCSELVLQEGSLTGWGKRTRRLPRQRCSLGSSSAPLK